MTSKKDYMQKFRQRNKRTVDGWMTKVYGRMRSSSKIRGMSMPSFTKQELKEWAVNNKIEERIKRWSENGCLKNETPSVNRLDDYKPYTLGNIELTNWEDNNKKGRGSVKVKELVHSALGNIAKKMFSRPVVKSDLNGKVLALYPSAREAARQNDTDCGAISSVCRGEKHTHHNYKWTYVTN